MLGTVLICGLTPYNDYALNNTLLVGNSLPIGVIIMLFAFIVGVNAPLHRFKPKWAFSAGEITVSLGMALTSCCLPSSGLMRYFPATLVGPFWHAQGMPDYVIVLEHLHLARWIFPSFSGSKVSDWISDPIVEGFTDHLPLPPPYRAWLVPAFAWGLFLFALYGALMCFVSLVRRQWMENERLAFPLAEISLAIIEQPEPGFSFSPVLRSRPFWIAFGAVFLLEIWNGLAQFYPIYFPVIPVKYDLTPLFKDRPWNYVSPQLMASTLFFSVVGVTFFIPNSVSFSIWFFFLFAQVQRMITGMETGDATNRGRPDQHFGGVFAFAIMILWIGRAHWMLILRQAFRGHRGNEPRGRYFSYPAAFWCLIFCCSFMVGWLWMAGASLIGAIVMLATLLTGFFVITRIIAETGLIHGNIIFPIYKMWDLLYVAGWKNNVSLDTYYLSGMLNQVHYDFREVMPVYASHALKIADQTIYDGRPDRDDTARVTRSTGRKLVAAIMLALLVGYVVSLSSMLWTSYNYSATLDLSNTSPINAWALQSQKTLSLGPATNFYKQSISYQYNPFVHLIIGAATVVFLMLMRWRYAWWPLHPIGFLLIDTPPGQRLWLSIFVGWVIKTMIVKFGGAKLYTRSKTFFLGMIVGESMAAGFWLITVIILSLLHIGYRSVPILPQ